MIEKVVSGGQIGADIAGLKAARVWGIQTGGFMPRGFRTLQGRQPDYSSRYGLKQTATGEYPERTFLNVQVSDGTVRFAVNFDTRGERCTLKAITKFSKPYFDVQIRFDEWWPQHWCAYPPPGELAKWIETAGVKVLNVSGNAKLDIEPIVEEYLKEVFSAGR